jgi:hypothetical protein
MALPGVGNSISISQIRTELGTSSGSLRTLSSLAGFSTPDAMSEFYGYSASDPDFLLFLKSSESGSYPGSGTTWYDISGKGNNGTLTNKYASNPIWTGSGFEFQGSNPYGTYQYGRYVSFPNYQFSRISSQNRVTLNVWFYATESSYPMILAGTNFNGSTTYQGYQLWIYGTTLYGRISGGGTTYVDVAHEFSLNTYVHATLTYDGTTARLYINGSLAASSAISVTMNYAAPGLFLIGAQYNATGATNIAEFYTGYIVIVRLYSRAISGAEASAIYSEDVAS